MTRTDRRRFPILFAAIIALAIAVLCVANYAGAHETSGHNARTFHAASISHSWHNHRKDSDTIWFNFAFEIIDPSGEDDGDRDDNDRTFDRWRDRDPNAPEDADDADAILESSPIYNEDGDGRVKQTWYMPHIHWNHEHPGVVDPESDELTTIFGGSEGPWHGHAVRLGSPVQYERHRHERGSTYYEEGTLFSREAHLDVDVLAHGHGGDGDWYVNHKHNPQSDPYGNSHSGVATQDPPILKGRFVSPPAQHDGKKRVKMRVAFSEAIDESPENVGKHGVKVEGGRVTSVRRVGGQAPGGAGTRSVGSRNAGQEDDEQVWEFEIEPDSDGDLTVSLDAGRPCDEPGAICTEDGRSLSEEISTTVKGPAAEEQEPQPQPDQEEEEQPQEPAALTASFTDVPAEHNGENAIRFRVAFSEDIGISFQSLRENAFTVSGGAVTRARRVDGRHDLWEITVEPGSDEAMTIALPGGRECAVSGAICTRGENRRKLTNTPSATVRAPAAEEQEPQQQAQQEPDQEEEEEEQPQEPPPAPRNLTGVANSDGSVTLSWDAPGDDTITGYQILRRDIVKQDSGVFTTVANTGTTATTYTDRGAAPETRYAYRVRAVNAAGTSKRSNYVKVTTKTAAPASKQADADSEPSGLAPNEPNPFNPSTVISYRLNADGPVRLEIYNLLGQRIRTLVDEVQAAGAYRVHWDVRDAAGRHMSTGIYFTRLYYPGGVQTRRMLYLK